MKISGWQSTIVAIPRQRPLKTTYGESPDTVTVVLQLHTDEGITGLGQTVAPAPWYGETAESIKINIDRYIMPAIVGMDPLAIEAVFAQMVTALRGANYAYTAIDYALWDIKGKALNVPVYTLLGGPCTSGALLHALVERTEAETAIERVHELYEQGWRWFKTKIGFGAQADLAWYREVRTAVPEDVRFQIDGNTGYTLGNAVQTLVAIEQEGGLGLIEQPVRYLDEMAELAKRVSTPLQADEALTGPRSVFEIATAKAAHVLHFKVHKYGGLLPAQRMAAVAEAAGLELSIAPYFDILAAAAAHLAAATPSVRWPAGFSDMTDTILAEPFLPKDQLLFPPHTPGLGVILDTDKLDYYGRAD
ncbi:MAG: enolase C-terminal domain-like protein [Chloroflexota bacterium]